MSVDDFKMLANRILDFAKSAIAEDGGLFPIGATVTVDGEVIPLTRVQPPSDDDTAGGVVDEILRAFRGLARDKRVRAVGWCVDMLVVPPGSIAKTDALVLFLESAEGEARVLVTPYHGAPGRGTTFAASYTQVKPAEIFVA